MNSFVKRHAANVIGVLSGFDRVRLRGTLMQITHLRGMMQYLSYKSVLLKNFRAYAKDMTKRICQRAEDDAKAAGRPHIYLNSSQDSKEYIARLIAERDGIDSGLICTLSCVEPCYSFHVGFNHDKKFLELRYQQTKCKHYYHYLMDPQLGFLNVRLQTWLPFSLNVCLNGREWLARQMDAASLGYVRRDNCFLDLEDPVAAQQLMNQQLRASWQSMMNRLTRQTHPLHRELFGELPQTYYWSVAQSEWATDVMFRDPESLAELYPRLIRHGMTAFSSPEVMRFLGHNVPAHGGVRGNFKGEVMTDLRSRPEGVRIRHRAGKNQIKMYDKQGSVLRVETTLNDGGPFKVYRKAQPSASAANHDAPPRRAWRKLRKGVADIARRGKVCEGANDRYLDAMSKANHEVALGKLTEPLCQPTTHAGRRVRALNPLGDADRRLLAAVNRGEFTLQGFRNKDIRALLFDSSSSDAKTTRKESSAVYRQLRVLLGHGLIYKIPKTHRYQVTELGRTSISAVLHAHQADTAQLLTLAA